MEGTCALSYLVLFAFKAVSGLQLNGGTSQKEFGPTFLQSSVAKCMDGTPAGYFFDPASSSDGEDKWVIHLQGGGECSSEDLCRHRLSGGARSSCLGSSANWGECFPTKGSTFIHLNALDKDQSPTMYQWNHVLVPYCSQDLWSGTKGEPSSATFGFRFSGHLILDAVVTELIEKYSLQWAKTVVLTGDSAGGIGSFINVDWLQSRVPAALVVAAPIAGFYFYAYPYQGPDHARGSPLAGFKEEDWPTLVKLWGSFLPSNCVGNVGKPASCMLSAYNGPYVNAPMFVIEAQTDAVQIFEHNSVRPRDSGNLQFSSYESEFMQQWQQNQTNAMVSSLKPSDGYFNPACFIHTKFTKFGPFINGLNYAEAFDSWMFDKSEGKFKDTCGLVCGTSCPEGYY